MNKNRRIFRCSECCPVQHQSRPAAAEGLCNPIEDAHIILAVRGRTFGKDISPAGHDLRTLTSIRHKHAVNKWMPSHAPIGIGCLRMPHIINRFHPHSVCIGRVNPALQTARPQAVSAACHIRQTQSLLALPNQPGFGINPLSKMLALQADFLHFFSSLSNPTGLPRLNLINFLPLPAGHQRGLALGYVQFQRTIHIDQNAELRAHIHNPTPVGQHSKARRIIRHPGIHPSVGKRKHVVRLAGKLRRTLNHRPRP